MIGCKFTPVFMTDDVVENKADQNTSEECKSHSEAAAADVKLQDSMSETPVSSSDSKRGEKSKGPDLDVHRRRRGRPPKGTVNLGIGHWSIVNFEHCSNTSHVARF